MALLMFLRQLGKDPRLFSNTCLHRHLGASSRSRPDEVHLSRRRKKSNPYPDSDFRLKQAGSKVGDAGAGGMHLALLETWMLVRREMAEIGHAFAESEGDIKTQLELDLRFLRDRKNYLEEKLVNLEYLECDHLLLGQAKGQQSSVKEGGIAIQTLENPVRSNDGTSSGAKAEARLREARRKVLDSLKKN
ncbi:hypothetical protein THAOC_01505 [Thalassiosira oceanica]|uniref:Uncharacterized protein n=1 Tax=Thalassiosira oceanica TaxID=159749 RepID=K0TDI3_THAOC|nr:hypothetical protein THAOC_01505 [Thalassiosira oceanica]|eukprot:EJK76718.1 hypothetical protein THAOC_01505 [Thalassiosira oceanica]